MRLTFSIVWFGSFHNSPDSPRSPYVSETTLALPPCVVTTAIIPAARQTKSAACAPTTSKVRPWFIQANSFQYQQGSMIEQPCVESMLCFCFAYYRRSPFLIVFYHNHSRPYLEFW